MDPARWVTATEFRLTSFRLTSFRLTSFSLPATGDIEMRLKVGDRVRAKVRTIFGWRGTGKVIDIIGTADDSVVDIQKDDDGTTATFFAYQLAKLKGNGR
jgi:hypothetical protein